MADQAEHLRKLAFRKGFRPEEGGGSAPRSWKLPIDARSIRVWILVLVVGTVSFLIGSGASTSTSASSSESGRTPASPSMRSAVSSSTLSTSGYVVATRRAIVAAQITGRVDEILFEEGDRVQRGQVLARIDGRVAAADLAEARATELTAAAGARALIARLQEARLRYQRASALVQRGFTSRATLDEAEASVARLEAELDQARSQRNATVAQASQRRLLLDQHTIRAPFDGVITVKNAQVGEIISPISAGGSFTRTGIGTLVAMDSLVVEVDVNEAFIGAVRPGARAIVVAAAYPQARLRATVASIIPTAQRERSSVRVRLNLDPTHIRLMPEMSVTAEIETLR